MPARSSNVDPRSQRWTQRFDPLADLPSTSFSVRGSANSNGNATARQPRESMIRHLNDSSASSSLMENNANCKNNGRTAIRQTHTFPVLSHRDILQIMHDVNIPLADAELTNPGQSRICQVFEQLVSTIEEESSYHNMFNE
jgi:hypothetical protein